MSSRTRTILLSFALLAPMATCVPCSAAEGKPAAPATRPAHADAWLLHLPGIAGETGIDRGLVRGLREGGFDGEIQIYDWTGPTRGISALLAHKRQQQEAAKIADLIAKRRREHPTERIVLTGHSAGTGLAVWALEMLPEDVTVDTVLLLSPALSPTYDLSKALPHVKGNVYSFPSPYDSAVLGLGTRLFGTVDGKKTEAAGKVGFTPPEGADEKVRKVYEKLVERPYDRAWMRLGNIGNHIGPMIPTFAEKVLTPLVLPDRPGVVVVKGTGGAATKPASRPAH